MASATLDQFFSLAGRVALVTGAGGDIGGAIARALAAAGATVALNGRNAAKLDAMAQQIRAAGGVAESFPGDISDLGAIPALVEGVREGLGGADILVNCAGINRRMPIADVTPAIYDEIMATNLRGLYFLSQAMLPLLQERGGGKVLHIGSLTSLVGLNDVSVYGMAKSAVAQLTKTMAIEWAPFNVQVNCLCPGFIQTALAAPNWENERRRAWMLSRLPIQRPGQPEDVAGAALFLVSPAASYITGQALFVDGGFTAGSSW